MKKFVSLLIITLFICLLLSGCVKITSTETFTDKVKIACVYYEEKDIDLISAGTSIIIFDKPAVYGVSVIYNHLYYDFDNKEYYDKYKDRKGEMIDATIQKFEYEGGSVRYRVVSLE